MPAVEIDVENIPDIIEAQLTLSYSRLSNLIRVIVDQGNGHESDIAEMKARLDRLQRENAELRGEVDSLKERKADEGRDAKEAALQAELETLRRRVNELADAQESEAAQQRAAHAAHSATAGAMKEDLANSVEATDAVKDAVAALLARVQEVERASSLPKAFTDLWAGRPELIFAMASPDEQDANAFEHSVEERTAFLHTLPAFVQLRDELGVLRTLINKQAAEALTAAARNSRSNSATVVNADPQLAEALRLLEQRLASLEKREKNTAAPPAPHRGSRDDGEALRAEMAELQDRLGHLEERLSRLFVAKDKTEDGGEDGGEDAVVANPALADLSFRLLCLEQTVEGDRSRNGAHDATAESKAPENVPDAPAGSDTGRGAGSSSNSQVAIGEAVKDGPFSGGGRSSSATQRPPIATRTNSLPPLSVAASQKPQQQQPTRPSSAAGSGAAAAGRGTPLSRRVSQPTVESLRVLDAVAGSPLARNHRISVAVEPDEGLRRRVDQLEENTAILEVNKADRRELQQLEEALRNLSLQTQQQQPHSQRANGYGLSTPLAPHRPSSAANPSGSAVGAGGYNGGGDAYGEATRSRPATSGHVGRPLFVGGSGSVNLRDGGRLTPATISPTPQP